MTNSEKKNLILRSFCFNIIQNGKDYILNQIDTLECTLKMWTGVKKSQELLKEKLEFLYEYYGDYLNINTRLKQTSKNNWMMYVDISFKDNAPLDSIITVLRIDGQLNTNIDSLVKEL